MGEYNYLTIIKELDSREYSGRKRKFVRCLCDCGNIIERPKSLVVNGRVKSCGCIRAKNRTEMIGKRFGKWTVIKDLPKEKGRRMELCVCECGTKRKVFFGSLINGKSLSCGCNQDYKYKYTKDVPNRERLLRIYKGMIKRCCNPNEVAYKHYGQRGISICNEWINENTGFENFAKWANDNGYNEKLSIDRIDVNGNYEPSNCRWVTAAEQSRNKRNNMYLTYNGKTMTITEWSREVGCTYNTILYRLLRGWDIEDVITKPIRSRC